MAGASDSNPSPFATLQGDVSRMRKMNLDAAIGDVDKIIELLESTRQQVAEGKSPGLGVGEEPSVDFS